MSIQAMCTIPVLVCVVCVMTKKRRVHRVYLYAEDSLSEILPDLVVIVYIAARPKVQFV